MMKKILKITAAILLIILGCVIIKFNVYDTQFYSVFFHTAKIHTPLELEEISYISRLSPELERAIVLNEEEDLAMWEDFLEWLNNTEFKKVRSTWGRSYTGEGIWLKFKGVEEELWIVVSRSMEDFKMGDYVWTSGEEIVLPVDVEYLLEKKAEQEKKE